MKVQIEGNFYIESDDREFTLKEYTGKISKPAEGKTEGVPLFKTHGYFSDVQGAAHKFLKLKIGSSEAKNLLQLIADVESIREMIRKQIDF
ncbi:hypothetical protein [Paenibacillus donghaensis]|uniref:Uncharacterized protein n=1 Tax=Paenibacillus donghaensis TaxID=414771 RepID=A0A2Z2K6W5_9BACL|nr:hypothetical protein [Paenibacillus donghaensis]ASA22026.1 hypothetical protein B9T62_15335 [Paenibacillus donghaensis]